VRSLAYRLLCWIIRILETLHGQHGLFAHTGGHILDAVQHSVQDIIALIVIQGGIGPQFLEYEIHKVADAVAYVRIAGICL